MSLLHKLEVDDFHVLLAESNVKKMENNFYSYRLSPDETVVFSKHDEIYIIHEIIKYK